MMQQEYLPFHPAPSTPVFTPPAGAVDAHCHVFGPAVQFPFAAERKYTPCDAPKEKLFELRDFLGFERNVIVQATCHGADNRALVDALEASNQMARGVAVVNSGVTDEELHRLHQAGVRGVRFNFVKRLVDATPKQEFLRIADRIRSLGWHIVVYFEAPDLAELKPFLLDLGTTIVVDHMGRPDISQGYHSDQFQDFIQFMADNVCIWSKVSCPERLSISGPPEYKDVVPFSRLVVESFPDRVLWGTDWPHPNMRSHMPDDGQLVNLIPHIAQTDVLQQALLVDNPMRLYWQD